MNAAQIVKEAHEDVNSLIKQIDLIVDAHLKSPSGLNANQRIVNVGRAINAYHVAWIENLKGQTDQLNNEILLIAPALKKKKPFTKPSIKALGGKK